MGGRAGRVPGGAPRSRVRGNTSIGCTPAPAVSATLPDGTPVTLDNGQHILIGAYTRNSAPDAAGGVAPEAACCAARCRCPCGWHGLQTPRYATHWPAPLDAIAAIATARGWNWRERASLHPRGAGLAMARFYLRAAPNRGPALRQPGPTCAARTDRPSVRIGPEHTRPQSQRQRVPARYKTRCLAYAAAHTCCCRGWTWVPCFPKLAHVGWRSAAPPCTWAKCSNCVTRHKGGPWTAPSSTM